MFESMLDEIDLETIRILFSIEVANKEMLSNIKENNNEEVTLQKPDFKDTKEEEIQKDAKSLNNPTFQREKPKIGRNDPCYCDSGKKYKHCCGK